MGKHWTITIQGTGTHHSSEAGDANLLAASFVQELQEYGQKVEEALFMHKWGRDRIHGGPKVVVSDLVVGEGTE